MNSYMTAAVSGSHKIKKISFELEYEYGNTYKAAENWKLFYHTNGRYIKRYQSMVFNAAGAADQSDEIKALIGRFFFDEAGIIFCAKEDGGVEDTFGGDQTARRCFAGGI